MGFASLAVSTIMGTVYFIKIFRFLTQISILISHTCPYLLHLIWTITGKKTYNNNKK